MEPTHQQLLFVIQQLVTMILMTGTKLQILLETLHRFFVISQALGNKLNYWYSQTLSRRVQEHIKRFVRRDVQVEKYLRWKVIPW